MPRPLARSLFSGASGSTTSSGSKPAPSSSIRISTCFRREAGLDLHLLVGVLPVAVLDGVGDRFAQRETDPVPRVLGGAAFAQRIVHDRLHQLDVLEPAADRQMKLPSRGRSHG